MDCVDQLAEHAAKVVKAKVDVIICAGDAVFRVAQQGGLIAYVLLWRNSIETFLRDNWLGCQRSTWNAKVSK
jgi:hypothetical protein